MNDSTTDPTEGDERTRDCFAWFPVRLDDGRFVHLQWFRARERFAVDYGGHVTGYWLRVGASADEPLD